MSPNYKFFVKKNIEDEAKPYVVLRYALLYAKKNNMTVYDENNNVLYTGNAVAEKLADLQIKTATKMLKNAEQIKAETQNNSEPVEQKTTENIPENSDKEKEETVKVLEQVSSLIEKNKDVQEEDPDIKVPEELYNLMMQYEEEGIILEDEVSFATDDDIDKIFEDDCAETKLPNVKESIILRFVNFIKKKIRRSR